MLTRANSRSIEVLLVEDSPGDVRLTQEAFRSADPPINLHIATDGIEAVEFLRRNSGESVDAPRPDLILLDLNLPRLGGLEVLSIVKADQGLKTIPTVILTTSEAAEDVATCYKLQANSYLTKPVSFVEFENLVLSINDYWLKKSTLPGTAIN